MKILVCSFIMCAFLTVSFIANTRVQAGTKDLVAGKKVKYKDNSAKSMRDVFERGDGDEKNYRKTMLANSRRSIKLLAEIRDYLRAINIKTK